MEVGICVSTKANNFPGLLWYVIWYQKWFSYVMVSFPGTSSVFFFVLFRSFFEKAF